MHVTPFGAATMLVFAIASSLHAEGNEVFAGYSAARQRQIMFA